ncbi:MAG: choice-of-anchor D domain-containing protein [Prosthecobacter sp.]
MNSPPLRHLLAIVFAAMVTLLGTAQAGTWSFQSWTTDSDTAIAPGSTTAAYHFGDTRTATVNGVSVPGSFQGLSSSLLDVDGSPTSIYGGATNTLTALGGNGSAILASGFNYNGVGGPMTVTAKGLNVGQTYAVSFFGVGFEASGRHVTFTSGADSTVVNQDHYGNGKGIRVTYHFTATASTRSFTLTETVFNYSWGLNAVTVRTTAAPTAITNGSGSVTTTSASLTGVFGGNGANAATSFEYSTHPTLSSGVTTVTTQQVWDYDYGGVAANLSGLSPNTTYYFRAKATNSVGTTQGAILSFTTSANPPTATTGAASSITSTGATLNGTVNANGESTAVTFQYGPTTSYGQTATASQSPVSGSSNTSVSAVITSLPPGTYHFRVAATNPGGTTNGSDATFIVPLVNATATFNAASDVAVTASNPVLTGGTATLALDHTPATGTNLMVVKNTGLEFISGTFSNLAHGQTVALSHGGVTYDFVANYYGGTGNDLVLVWKNNRPLAWGRAGEGQLGNNSTTQSNMPVGVLTSGVLSGRTVVSVAAGYHHNLALSSDGTLAAWGYNHQGQLGNSSTAQSAVPVAVNTSGVLSGKTVIAVATGREHSLALCSDGTLAAWGGNGYGQLGNNSTTQSSVPVAVNTSGVLAGKMVVAVAAGLSHSVALCSDGTLAAWGYNSEGRLGNNSTTNSSVPVAVNTSGLLSGKTAIAVAAGNSHNLALCSDGTLAAWGSNYSGQLGNNGPTQSTVPVAVNTSGVLSGKTLVSVAAGGFHSMALCSDGTLAAWGDNFYGQLGNNSTTHSTVPVAVNTSGVLAGKTTVSVAAGENHSEALCSDGTLAAWGLNIEGQLGNNSTTDSSVPVAVRTSALTAGERFTNVSCSNSATHTVALVAVPPSIGNTTITYTSATDIPVTAASPILGGGIATLSLAFAPEVGTNLMVVNNTGLGFISGTFSNLAQGQAVSLSHGGVMYRFVANYYGGSGNDLVLQWSSVRAMGWGNNGNGQLGNNSTTNSRVPAAVRQSGVLAGKTVIATTAGLFHTLALCSDGTLAAWGDNSQGQLGNNSTTPSSVPVAVLQSSGVLAGKMVVAISAGREHSLALCSDGTLAAWGDNGPGLLGNGSTTDSSVPVAVTASGVLAGKTVIAIAAGFYHSLALCSDGTLAAWGSNSNGGLGNNTTTTSNVPVAVVQSGVLAGKTVIAIAGGTLHSLALCSDGTLAGWGSNVLGQLGNNSSTDSSVPVGVNMSGVLAGKTVIEIAAGGDHSLALCADGTLAAWGSNSSGQLGNNSTTNSSVPVAVLQSTGVLTGKTVIAISTGNPRSMALCSDGTLVAWGNNGYGQLGNDSTTNSSVPVAVSTSTLAAGERFTAVGRGLAQHALALVAAPLVPEILIEQPVGTVLTGGTGTISFGSVVGGTSSAANTFILRNLGTSDLTGIVITQDGANAGDYTVSTTGMASTVAPNASTTFTVTFTPAAAAVTGARTAVLHIASNDEDENPFDIALSGTGLSQTYDTDSDGLNDAAEFQLATLGFDWQTAQAALVTTLTTNANTANLFSQGQVDASRQAGQNDVTGTPNIYGLYTQAQFQALSVGVPLLQKNGATGQFKLTIGVQKSADLINFDAFPVTAPQTTVNAQGQLEIQFTVPDSAAFFRLQPQ